MKWASSTWSSSGEATINRRQVRQLVARHDLHPSRALGQNFVIDPNTVRRVARLAGVGRGDRVLEIGAGLGALTLALRETGADVTAVEIDRKLLPVLREVVAPAGVTVVEGDALTLDWGSLLGEGRWTLVANLPYNIATPLVVRLLDTVPAIDHLLVMVQREVGERFAATPGSGAYGAVSVKIGYRAIATVVGRVPPTVFWPEPKVESALVDIRRRTEPSAAGVDEDWLFRLVTAGFGQRRKMLRRSLAGLATPEQLSAAGIRPEARAEELGLHEWLALAASVRPPE